MRYALACVGVTGSGLLQGRRICTLANGWVEAQIIHADLMPHDQLHAFMLAPCGDTSGDIHDYASYSTF